MNAMASLKLQSPADIEAHITLSNPIDQLKINTICDIT